MGFRVGLFFLLSMVGIASNAIAQEQNLLSAQTPRLLVNSDGPKVNYELGMKFSSTAAGQITAIRFYKSPSESGQHIGRLFLPVEKFWPR